MSVYRITIEKILAQSRPARKEYQRVSNDEYEYVDAPAEPEWAKIIYQQSTESMNIKAVIKAANEIEEE
jgi:hypothetical protein